VPAARLGCRAAQKQRASVRLICKDFVTYALYAGLLWQKIKLPHPRRAILLRFFADNIVCKESLELKI
jgi:hypothetical protein